MLLSEVRKQIIDLKRSKWDKEKSIPEKGIYVFENDSDKVYYKNSDFNDEASRPDHVLKFVAYDNSDNYSQFRKYAQKFKAEPVTVGDPYLPELLTPDAENHYIFMDTILVKIPINVWFSKKNEDRKRYDAGHKLTDAAFKGDVGKDAVEFKVE